MSNNTTSIIYCAIIEFSASTIRWLQCLQAFSDTSLIPFSVGHTSSLPHRRSMLFSQQCLQDTLCEPYFRRAHNQFQPLCWFLTPQVGPRSSAPPFSRLSCYRPSHFLKRFFFNKHVFYIHNVTNLTPTHKYYLLGTKKK